MAKRGDTAREAVKNKIIEAFGEDFCGIADKKIYVRANDGGEMIQFAIAMTMPKTSIDFGDGNVELADGTPVAPATTPTELSGEDKEKVAELMRKLNIAPAN